LGGSLLRNSELRLIKQVIFLTTVLFSLEDDILNHLLFPFVLLLFFADTNSKWLLPVIIVVYLRRQIYSHSIYVSLSKENNNSIIHQCLVFFVRTQFFDLCKQLFWNNYLVV